MVLLEGLYVIQRENVSLASLDRARMTETFASMTPKCRRWQTRRGWQLIQDIVSAAQRKEPGFSTTTSIKAYVVGDFASRL